MAAWAIAVALAAPPLASAAHASPGTPVPESVLSIPGGRELRFPERGTPGAAIFVRAGQERSRAMLRELAACEGLRTAGSLRWLLVTSDEGGASEILEAAKRSGFEGRVAIDRGDALYASLGVAAHPVLVLVDADARLAAFEPYRSIGFCETAAGRVRQLLGGAQPASAEPAVVADPNAVAAKRYQRLAHLLCRDGKREEALAAARQGLQRDPSNEPLAALARALDSQDATCPMAP